MAYLITFYFIVMDFFTGLLKAYYTGLFSSKIMRRGLFHKASLLCVMALGWLVDYAQGYIDLGVNIPVGGACCGYIVLMEICSSIENLCQSNPELMPDRLCHLFGVSVNPPHPSPASPVPPSPGGGRQEDAAETTPPLAFPAGGEGGPPPKAVVDEVDKQEEG